MSEKAFIHFYCSPRGYYFYDVNKDTIISINENIYDYLNDRVAYNDLQDNNQKYIDELKLNGYLSDKHFSEIRHPDLDNLKYFLDCKCSQLILQVTQSCNLVCYYCAYANKSNGILQRDHTNKMMSWETAKTSIDFFYQHSKDNDEVTISFYGGEPLIAFDLVKKSVLYAEQLFLGKKLSFNMTTNSTLFNDEIINFIVEHQFTILFSIDGPESIHDINRKKADGTGSFKVAFENMRKVAECYGEYASQRLMINMVLNPINDVDEVLKLFDDKFFEQYKIGVSSTLADDDYLEKKIEVTESYHSKMTYLYFLGFLDFLGLVEGLKIPPFIKTHMASLYKKYSKYKHAANGLPDVGAPGGPCIPGQRRLFVDADGTLYPCERVSETTDSMKIGNIYDGFDYNKAAKILNVANITSEKCKNCYAAIHCQLCAKCADVGDHFSAKERLKHCYETYNSFDDEMLSCILIKESRTIYKRRR